MRNDPISTRRAHDVQCGSIASGNGRGPAFGGPPGSGGDDEDHTDLFKNLSVSHGVVGERNSWYNSNQPATLTENVANVNLCGLGASRTLVLLNGRRHVPVPARLIGGRFVDVSR